MLEKISINCNSTMLKAAVGFAKAQKKIEGVTPQ